MPYVMRKVPKRRCYTVKNKNTKRVLLAPAAALGIKNTNGKKTG